MLPSVRGTKAGEVGGWAGLSNNWTSLDLCLPMQLIMCTGIVTVVATSTAAGGFCKQSVPRRGLLVFNTRVLNPKVGRKWLKDGHTNETPSAHHLNSQCWPSPIIFLLVFFSVVHHVTARQHDLQGRWDISVCGILLYFVSPGCAGG